MNRNSEPLRNVAERSFTDKGRYPPDVSPRETERRLEIFPKADRIRERAERHFERNRAAWTGAEQRRPYTAAAIGLLERFDIAHPRPTWAPPPPPRVPGAPKSQRDASTLIKLRQEQRVRHIGQACERMINRGKFASTGFITGAKRGGGTHRN